MVSEINSWQRVTGNFIILTDCNKMDFFTCNMQDLCDFTVRLTVELDFCAATCRTGKKGELLSLFPVPVCGHDHDSVT